MDGQAAGLHGLRRIARAPRSRAFDRRAWMVAQAADALLGRGAADRVEPGAADAGRRPWRGGDCNVASWRTSRCSGDCGVPASWLLAHLHLGAEGGDATAARDDWP